MERLDYLGYRLNQFMTIDSEKPVRRYVRVVGDIENRGKVTIDYGLHDSFYHIVKVKVGEK